MTTDKGSLADAISNAHSAEEAKSLPNDYKKHTVLNGDGTGEAATGIVDSGLIKGDLDLLELAGLDPKIYEIIPGKKQMWYKETGSRRRSIYFQFREIIQQSDRLAELLASKIEVVAPKRNIKQFKHEPMVIPPADEQIGKRDVRGGTLELLNRHKRMLEIVGNLAADTEPDEILLPHLGDGNENNQSNTSTHQISTNDLPANAEQIPVLHRMWMENILTFNALTGHLVTSVARSNHGQERSDGKAVASGDYGVSTMETIKTSLDMLQPNHGISFLIPSELEHVQAYSLGGANVAWTHGHLAKRDENFPQWVANQAATPTNPLAFSTIVLHGHFHFPSVRVSRGRWLFGAPTLDNGSTWFEQSSGEWSLPGMLTFWIRNGKPHNVRFIESES